MSDSSNDPMIGRLVDGRYQVRSRIARGGMATVYLATDLRLERRVAIKVMHGHLADDRQFKERFIQEARSAARLAHPNVVNVFDQGQDSDMAYLVMEYLPGITLRDLLHEHKSLTSEQTLDILEAVLSGLAAAHKAGIVHRDLKPENVLLADDGRIKIGDFGLARAASANTATGAALLGTIAYLSPELVTRGIADTRSDIYAVGIMMYEMLAGEQPFKGEQPMQIAYQHANGSVPTPSTKNPRVPAELDELVLWATARDPDQRPRDAKVMLEQLLETQQQLATALPQKPGTQRTAPVQRTVAMPVAFTEVIGSDAETQVLGTRNSHRDTPRRSAAESTPATTLLAERSGKRRARGWWLFGLVILLAGVAGGTGWFFGPGPGGAVAIPTSIISQSPEDATATLTSLGFTVADKHDTVNSPSVADGRIVASNPTAGESVSRGSTITLTWSKGPKAVAAPTLDGKSETDAKNLIAASGLVYDSTLSSTRFDPKVAAGIVLSAYGVTAGTTDSVRLKSGDGYYDQGRVGLRVSLGALPPVAGLTIDAATAALTNLNLKVVASDPVFNDTVPKGSVISVSPLTPKPTDTVTLTVSNGQDLVPIPANIVGQKIPDANAALVALGFKVQLQTNVPVAFQNLARVQSIKGGTAGQGAKRGSTITLVANYALGNNGDGNGNGNGN